MKKSLKKFTKILVLIAMIFSDLMTPISVLANEITNRDPAKGDVGIDNKVTNNGEMATVSVGSTKEEGGVKVTKTVSKIGNDGEYEIKFKVEGKDVETTTVSTKPIYAAVVFDRSGSMESTETEKCVSWKTIPLIGIRYCDDFKIVSDNKWESAVDGAKLFARTLRNRFSNANLSLVAFDTNVSVLTNPNGDGFVNSDFDSINFGEPYGVTNLTGALNKAKKLLDAKEGDYTKYVVVISDGAPTDLDGYATNDAAKKAINAAKLIKDEDVKIFSIGYKTDETTSATLRSISSGDGYYADADPETVAAKFSEITSNITSSTFAGTEAVLKDNIGSNFTVVANDKITVDDEGNVTANIGNITEGGTEVTFTVKVDQDNTEGWVNVNEGFKLTYTNANNESDSKEYLKDEVQPQVYWERNTYNYTINYYKDSIAENNLLGSDNSNSAYKGDKITLTSEQKNAMLPEGYKLSSVDHEELEISNDSTQNIINVLYTKKELNFRVEYYFQNVNDDGYTENSSLRKNNQPALYGDEKIASSFNDIAIPNGYHFNEEKTNEVNNGKYTITNNDVVIKLYYDREVYSYTVRYLFKDLNGNYVERTDIPSRNIANVKYGTEVSTSAYELVNAPTGFALNRAMTEGNNQGKYVITNNQTIINIYYDRSNYKLNVNYHFNGEFDKVYNYTKDAAYGAAEKSSDYTLEKVNSDYLNSRKNKDNKYYFLDSSRNNDVITIGTGDNTLNVYYISTEFDDTEGKLENITKVANTEKVVSTLDTVSYTINYTNTIKNIKNGDKAVVTITDKLPQGIDEKNSNLNGGLYDKDTNTITWVIEETAMLENGKELAEEYIVNINPITYTVKYNDYLEVNGRSLNNIAEGKIQVIRENDVVLSSEGKEANAIVPVEIKGTVTIYFKDENGNEIDTRVVKGPELVKTTYSAEANNIKDYTLDETKLPENANGSYVEGNIDVVYYYTKDKGTVVATYKDENGRELHSSVETTDYVGKEYTTEEKSFYGYTLKEVTGSSRTGKYVGKQTLYVNYIYVKNIGTSEEELNKDGIELVGSITDAFDYTITYNTEIKDYVGKATLTITDILPFEIDAEKSEISNNCKYIKENNTLLCKYEMDNTPIIINIGNININNNGQIEDINKNIIFNIEENFKLYYINVDKKEVTNKVTAELTYGNVTKTTDDEHTTEVEDGTVIVNYVTKDGEKLTDSITLTGPVGTTYETVKKEFDKYSFIEVKGEVEGTYTKGQKEVTYVYDLTILPPQTGVEANMFMYVNYIFALIALAVAFRTYKTIKNN